MSQELISSMSHQVRVLEKEKELYVSMVDKEIDKLKQRVHELTTPRLLNIDNL